MKTTLGAVAHECRNTWNGDKTGVPVVGLEHLEPGEVILSSWEIDSDNTFTKKFTKGQVLLGRRRVYLRKAVLAPVDGICSGDITVIEANPDKLLPELLPFIIQNDAFFNYAMKGSAGSLSPRVKWEHLKDYEISLPTLAEQRKLADKLWAAYHLKESYKRLLATTDEMVKSQFIEITSHLPLNGTIADIVDGNISSVKRTYTSNDEISYIDISSIDAGNNTITTVSSVKVGKAPSRAQQCVKRGDILVSTVRPNNRNIAVIDSDLNNLVASSGFCVLRASWTQRSYLKYIVTSDAFTHKMCDKASGGLYPAVNYGDVLSYRIHIPEDSLSQKLSDIDAQADKSKFELKEAIKRIDDVMKALMN